VQAFAEQFDRFARNGGGGSCRPPAGDDYFNDHEPIGSVRCVVGEAEIHQKVILVDLEKAVGSVKPAAAWASNIASDIRDLSAALRPRRTVKVTNGISSLHGLGDRSESFHGSWSFRVVHMPQLAVSAPPGRTATALPGLRCVSRRPCFEVPGSNQNCLASFAACLFPASIMSTARPSQLCSTVRATTLRTPMNRSQNST
jgi:hypothetical protein